MTDLPPELVEALAARDRSRLALANPKPRRTAGAAKRRKKTSAQKAARRRNRG